MSALEIFGVHGSLLIDYLSVVKYRIYSRIKHIKGYSTCYLISKKSVNNNIHRSLVFAVLIDSN